MPVIVQGRKQYIVSTETLLAWKRFQRERPTAVVDCEHGNALIVCDDSFLYRVEGKLVEAVD